MMQSSALSPRGGHFSLLPGALGEGMMAAAYCNSADGSEEGSCSTFQSPSQTLPGKPLAEASDHVFGQIYVCCVFLGNRVGKNV